MVHKSDEEVGSAAAANVAPVARPRKIGVAAKAAAKPLGRRQKNLEDKRAGILAAAQSLFSRFGLHGTSIDQVAEKADVSKSNLFYYFSSKEDLYLTVLRNILAVWLKPLESFDVDSDPEQALRAYIRHKLEISRNSPEASRLFCLEIVGGAPLLKNELAHGLRELLDRKSQVIRAWIEKGLLNDVEPHHFIFSIWAVTQHYADFAAQVQAITGKSLRDKAFFEETVAAVQRQVLQGALPRA